MVYAVRNSSDKHSPREQRHLDFIIQFTTDVRHVPGVANIPADALSRETQVNSLDLSELARHQRDDADFATTVRNPTFNVRDIPISTSSESIQCDISTGHSRPIVPVAMRRTVFNSLHGLSHPGIRATTKLIAQRFVWPNMNKDIREWTRQCIPCQQHKVQRHTSSPSLTIPMPDARFNHLHIDIVGPLPSSRGFTHIFTCVDRLTRWPEAIPLSEITSEAIARAFVENWISRFGSPSTITTDRGAQFESSLFFELTKILGCHRIRTTAYHPQANGMVERFHRQLKTALGTHQTSAWSDVLPLALLGIRNTLKADMKCAPATLVYGTTLRLPADLVSTKVNRPVDCSNYATRLVTQMRNLYPTPTRPANGISYIPSDLSTAQYVFLRIDSVRRPLAPHYTGPHPVIQRSPKTFVIDISGRRETVSIDRLKPAFVEETPSDAPSSSTPQPEALTERSPPSTPKQTRSGRRVRFPSKLKD